MTANKISLLAIVFLTLVCSLEGQQLAKTCGPAVEPNLISYYGDDPFYELSGRVKMVRRYKTWNIGVTKPELEEEVRFDRDGNEVASKHPNELAVDDEEEFRVEYECEGTRVLAEKQFNKDGSPRHSTKYKYDDAGNMIEIAEFFKDNTLERRLQYTLDKNSNIIKEVDTKQVHPEHFRPKRYDVYVTTSSTYRYDDRKRIVEEKGFYPNGTLYSTYTYTYDKASRRVRKVWTDMKGRPVDLEINVFDDRGLLTEKWKYQNFCYTKSPSSDQAGDLCPGKLNTDIGLFYYGTKTVYTYDNQKNWIKQLDLEISERDGKKAFKPSTSESRQIFYYKN